jgi:hypothetical protein
LNEDQEEALVLALEHVMWPLAKVLVERANG